MRSHLVPTGSIVGNGSTTGIISGINSPKAEEREGKNSQIMKEVEIESMTSDITITILTISTTPRTIEITGIMSIWTIYRLGLSSLLFKFSHLKFSSYQKMH